MPLDEQLRLTHDFAQTLVGLTVPIATARAVERGFLVLRIGPTYDHALTADMRANRITLDCSADDVVESATAG